MHKTSATVKRWIAAMGGDSRYPTSVDELSLEVVMRLQEADPVLLQLLQGNAPASVELQVLDGSLPDAAPTAQQRQDAAKQQQIDAILQQGNPWGSPGRYEGQGAEAVYIPGEAGNVTHQMALLALDPERAAQLQLQATPVAPKPGQLDEAGAAFVNAHLAGVR